MTAKADDELVANQALNAVTYYLKENPETCCHDFVDLVQRALAAPSMFAAKQEHGLSDATHVSVALDMIVEQCDYSESSLLCQRAALRVFVQQKSTNALVDKSIVAEAFVGELAKEIVGRRCLAVSREEVAQKCERTFEEQIEYEKRILSRVAKMARPIAAKVRDDQSLSKIRAPRRSHRTSPTLSTTLPVMPEAR
ncbi:MAG TPA: hypothetical protein VGK24_02390 [Candidatus Angelobacter sp.]|jgi:hypothetical protein